MRPDIDPRVYEVVCQARFAWDCYAAAIVFWCEMGGRWNPWAVGRLGERGMAQIHPIHAWRWPDYWTDAAFDPWRNVEYAWDVYISAHGFGPWTCYRR